MARIRNRNSGSREGSALAGGCALVAAMPDPSARTAVLARQLEAYAPPTAALADMRRRMLALAAGGAPSCSRVSFSPGHFTASAFVLSPDRHHLALILHAKLGLWLQPGGHIDPGDADLVAAARREAREEVGLDDLELAADGIWDVDIHDIPARKAEPAHQHFDVRFLFRSPTTSLRAASDAEAARWVPLTELAAQSDASVARAALLLGWQP
jgi:8-oxo-dGTP pyrophosphatase MutT (NUDIX family)